MAGSDGYLKKVNKRWEEVLGHSAQELCSRPMTDFIHPEDVEKTIQVRKTFSETRNILGFQNRYRCKDGTYRKFEWTAKRQGEYVIGVARDITSRFHKERLASIGELAAGAGHEINNPLMIANGQVDLILKRLLSLNQWDGTYQGYYDRFLTATGRISKIVTNLRQFSLEPSARQFIFEAHLAVRSAIESLRPTFEKKKITLRYETYELAGAAIKGQPEKLQLVLMNLLMNSQQALNDADVKDVEIKLEIVNDCVHICVQDTGPGVPIDLEEKIFSLFFTTKLAEKASGMGLSESQSLISEFDGEISYIRKPHGACFRVVLPLHQKY